MDSKHLTEHILASVNRILVEGGKPTTSLSEDSPLWGAAGVLDSLDLAVLVIELEELVGKDPFNDGFISFRTVGELAALYAD